jgi:hypothetical protein
MPDGVVHQVPDQPGQIFSATAYGSSRNPRGVDGDGGVLPCLRCFFEDDVVEVDQSERCRGGVGVRGEHQQVLDQPFHSLAVLKELVDHDLPVGAVRMRPGHLERGPERRERALELVGSVGDELTLASRRRLEPFQHGVHRVGEALDLIGGVGYRHPPVQRGVRDGRHFRADVLHRPQSTTDEHAGTEGEQRDSGGNPDRQGPAQGRDRLGYRLWTCADEHRRAALGRAGSLCPDPVGLGLGRIRHVGESEECRSCVGWNEGADRLITGQAGRRRQHLAGVAHHLAEGVVAQVGEHPRQGA